MTSGYQTFPDTEALAASVLRTALGIGVYSSIPRNPVYPLITVRRIGGVPSVPMRLDSARIQIDVWGTSKSEARDYADSARVALHGMEGKRYTTAGGDVVNAWVSGVVDDLGLTWLPDADTDRDRYIFGVTVYAHQ